jgi:hypothetical protein
MNSIDIKKFGSKIPCFLGCYSLKNLETVNIVKNNVGLIVINENHAIAIYITEKSIDVFDPFGNKNSKVFNPICKFLKLHLPTKILNFSAKIQAEKSNLCAKFCLVYLKLRCEGISFCEIIAYFTTELPHNDLIVTRLFKCLFL